MEPKLTFPAKIRTYPFWNWTRKHMCEVDNITKHSDHDDDVTSLVIVGAGIAMMIVMWIVHKYSNKDRQIR